MSKEIYDKMIARLINKELTYDMYMERTCIYVSAESQDVVHVDYLHDNIETVVIRDSKNVGEINISGECLSLKTIRFIDSSIGTLKLTFGGTELTSIIGENSNVRMLMGEDNHSPVNIDLGATGNGSDILRDICTNSLTRLKLCDLHGQFNCDKIIPLLKVLDISGKGHCNLDSMDFGSGTPDELYVEYPSVGIRDEFTSGISLDIATRDLDISNLCNLSSLEKLDIFCDELNLDNESLCSLKEFKVNVQGGAIELSKSMPTVTLIDVRGADMLTLPFRAPNLMSLTLMDLDDLDNFSIYPNLISLKVMSVDGEDLDLRNFPDIRNVHISDTASNIIMGDGNRSLETFYMNTEYPLISSGLIFPKYANGLISVRIIGPGFSYITLPEIAMRLESVNIKGDVLKFTIPIKCPNLMEVNRT